MKFIDFNGLSHFYEKIKASFATLNSSGKVPYKQLPDKVKKVKYIKKEKRYLFHKSIPISFEIDSEGNYNPQINGKYEDWYCSYDPVFRIAKGKKFRLFIAYKGNLIEDFKEVEHEKLEYWHLNKNKRRNSIEESGGALICNKDNPMNINADANTVPISFFNLNDVIGKVSYYPIFHIKQVDYEKITNVYSIYIEYKLDFHPIPWNKNLKWVGNKIECILPTNNQDIFDVLGFDGRFFRYNNDGCIIKYYKKFNNSLRLVKRRVVDSKTYFPRKTFIATAKYHYYNKQPSKFRLNFSSFNEQSGLSPEHAIKKVE